MSVELDRVAADIAYRLPGLVQDSPLNNAVFIANIMREGLRYQITPEIIGRWVRELGVEWAKSRPGLRPNETWNKTWEELPEIDREGYRVIGMGILNRLIS